MHLQKIKLPISSLTFPYIFIITKYHKNPFKFRFVTCATHSYNCQAGKIYFNLLSKILKKFTSMTTITVSSTGYKSKFNWFFMKFSRNKNIWKNETGNMKL